MYELMFYDTRYIENDNCKFGQLLQSLYKTNDYSKHKLMAFMLKCCMIQTDKQTDERTDE